jgi:folate-binding protein YgfZ
VTDGWARFVAAAGIEGDPEIAGDARFTAARAAESGELLCALDERAVLDIHGDQAFDFLQGQFTSDLREASDSHSPLSAYCNVKGRVLATFRIHRRDERWLLVTHRGVARALADRLRVYRMRARVDIEEDDSLVVLAVAGARVSRALEASTGALPDEPRTTRYHDELIVTRAEGPGERYELLADPSTAAEIWHSLVRAAVVGTSDSWRLTEIRSGVTFVEPATSEAFLPQMLGLDALGAVSFRKGCFPGQEVVARTEHLGRVRRKLYRARCVVPPDTLRAGSPLRALSSEGRESDGGTVVAAAAESSGGTELLAVIPEDTARSGAIHPESAPRAALELLALPTAH